MFKKTALLLVLMSSAVYAQAKVGTSGAQFLEQMTPVRSLGMGGVTVPLTDRQSFCGNPATLGLTSPYLSSLSFRPILPDLGYPGSDVNHQLVTFASRLTTPTGSWGLDAGLQIGHLSAGTMIERSYESGSYEGTGKVFSARDNSYALTVALSRLHPVAMAFGGTFRYVDEDFHDFSATGIAFDLGVAARFPLSSAPDSLSPRRPFRNLTIGFAAKNFGPDIKFIDKKFPLPSSYRFGAALEMQVADWTIIAATEEQMSTSFSDGHLRLGIETGYREAVWIRAGKAPNGDFADLATYGGSVSVRGVWTRLFTHEINSVKKPGFFHRLDLIASFASSWERAEVPGSGADSWQLEIVL